MSDKQAAKKAEDEQRDEQSEEEAKATEGEAKAEVTKPPQEASAKAPDEPEEGASEGKEEGLDDDFFDQPPAETKEEEEPAPLAPGTFEGEPVWGEQNDPVIPPLWKPALPLFMVIITILAMSYFADDFSFFFASRQPKALGTVQEGCTPSFYKKLKHNRFVTVKGLFAQPGMTAQARIQFQKQNYAVVMGCDLILSMPAAAFQKVSMRYFEAKGRMVELSRTSAMAPLKKYYEPSGILKVGKGTYLLYVGEHPNHYWWLLLVYVVLGILFLYNVWYSVLWGWKHWIKREGLEEPLASA